MNRSSTRTLWLLTGITALGGALRLSGLSVQSLWNDELASVTIADVASWRDVLTRLRGDSQPPGFALMLWWTLRSLGDGEAAARLIPALAGTLTIPALYLLGRRLLSEREGLLGAALLAVAWTPLAYSQEARPYALLVLATTVAAWGFIGQVNSAREGQPLSRLDRLTLVAGGALAVNVHYFGIVVMGFAAAATVLLCRRTGRLASLLWPYAVVALAFIPSVPEFRYDLGHAHTESQPASFLPVVLRQELSFLFHEPRLTDLVIGLFLVGAGVFFWRRRQGGPRSLQPGTELLLWWYLGVITVVWAESMLWKPLLVRRYLLIVMPAAFLLLARATTYLAGSGRARTVLPVLLVLVIGSELSWNRYYTSPHKEQFREVAELVAGSEPPGSRTAVLVEAYGTDYFDYYFRRLGRSFPLRLVPSPEELARIAGTGERVWLVWGHKQRPDGARADLEKGGLSVSRDVELTDAGAFLFEPASATPTAASP